MQKRIKNKKVFWNVMPIRPVNTYRRLEDTTIFQNVGKYLVRDSGNIPEAKPL
jgi:hypothetical protein